MSKACEARHGNPLRPPRNHSGLCGKAFFGEKMMATFEGGCACGAVRYRLTSGPMFVNCCHCRDCQRQVGSAFVINAIIETDRIELQSGEPSPTPMPTDSGRVHDIYRCSACG